MRARWIVTGWLALALITFSLASCALAARAAAGPEGTRTAVSVPPASPAADRTLAGFDARLQRLSTDPHLQRAAGYRLASSPSHDPTALGATVQSPDEPATSVHTVLAAEIDQVVIVDWLISFSAMGAWTATNPSNPEEVNIPVSAIPSLVQRGPSRLQVFRLGDNKHLMLVRPVMAGSSAVGAVGFILAEDYRDPVLDAAAVPLG
jgi:hypothetical protein